jgi:hypothetical protein
MVLQIESVLTGFAVWQQRFRLTVVAVAMLVDEFENRRGDGHLTGGEILQWVRSSASIMDSGGRSGRSAAALLAV